MERGIQRQRRCALKFGQDVPVCLQGTEPNTGLNCKRSCSYIIVAAYSGTVMVLVQMVTVRSCVCVAAVR
jgi:hypothetical protein